MDVTANHVYVVDNIIISKENTKGKIQIGEMARIEKRIQEINSLLGETMNIGQVQQKIIGAK